MSEETLAKIVLEVRQDAEGHNVHHHVQWSPELNAMLGVMDPAESRLSADLRTQMLKAATMFVLSVRDPGVAKDVTSEREIPREKH
ncbi:MAG: hypothetical protein AAF727_06205 [Pseudomonadota bacterium]